MKTCNTCLQAKNLEFFYKTGTECKVCKNKRSIENRKKLEIGSSGKEYLLKKKKYIKEWRKNNKEKHREHCRRSKEKHKTGINFKYITLRRSAKKRNLKLEIKKEQYTAIIKDRICYYCDYDFTQETGSNLNRINSNEGYFLENVKPCCSTCNKIMNKFTKEELKSRLIKIARRI